MVNADHIIYAYPAMPDGNGGYQEIRVMLTDTTELTLGDIYQNTDCYLDWMDEFNHSLQEQLEK